MGNDKEIAVSLWEIRRLQTVVLMFRRLPMIDVILLANTQDDERGLYIINVTLCLTLAN